MLNKTKQEFHPDLKVRCPAMPLKLLVPSFDNTLLPAEERRQRELLYKSERKKQRLQLEAEQRKAKLEYKQQKELRSYSYVAVLYRFHVLWLY